MPTTPMVMAKRATTKAATEALAFVAAYIPAGQSQYTEGFSASVIAALTVVFVYLTLRRWVRDPGAIRFQIE